MSTWGMWGYLGIVAGLLVLLALFFACMEIMFPTRKSAGEMESLREQEKPTTRHAA
jgi:hypothetical protein